LDSTVSHFLNWVRPRSRKAHLAAYEDLAIALEDFLPRRRRARPLRAAQVGPLLGTWYRRHGGQTGRGTLRRFCAALRVFARWHAQQLGTAPDSQRLLALTAGASRETLRAARISEMLDQVPSWPPPEPGAGLCDGYWQVVLLGKSHAVLREVGSAESIGPVALPCEVVRELRPGSILNLCLAADGERWRVVQHGLCYPALALGGLRAGVGPGPA
jgi:hypothetical protein